MFVLSRRSTEHYSMNGRDEIASGRYAVEKWTKTNAIGTPGGTRLPWSRSLTVAAHT
jgi:hypothetical protein